MPKGRHKSRTLRRVNVRTPGGKTVMHYRARLPQVAKCASCGVALKGIPRLRAKQMVATNKSKKTVARPYGGNLCSKCAISVQKKKARL